MVNINITGTVTYVATFTCNKKALKLFLKSNAGAVYMYMNKHYCSVLGYENCLSSVTILIDKLNFLGDLAFRYMVLMLGINMISLQKRYL